MQWKALALLGTAFFMVILDATIVFTAVPSIARDLHFSVSGVQWVATAYTLAFSGLMLFFGRLADLTGRRRLFMLGLALFTISSLLCGSAWSATVLVTARALQGVSAAIMAPAALSILTTLFTDERERAKALGIWGALGGIGATAGLLIGGLVTAWLGWEWIFYINVPVGLALLRWSQLILRESRNSILHRSFDPLGAITITGSLTLLVYAVVNAPVAGWSSAQTLALLTGAAAMLATFILIERRSKAPLVPFHVFRAPGLVSGNVVILAIGMSVDGMLFPLTFYAQDILGYSAMQFGLMSAVMTGMSVAGAFAGQALVTKIGLRPIGVAALLLVVTGCLLLAGVSADGSFAQDMLAGLLVFGPGMGAAFVSAQIAALGRVADQDSGLAAALVDTSFNIGSALGIACVTTILTVFSAPEMSQGDAAAGPRAAFLSAAGFAVLGLLAALFMAGRTRVSAATQSA
ncbi:MFS transporter [Nonomuraea sp. NPDC050663]|uniref:MFS transporter n=1 Tax=Nonomuraea sp. NPDC050663 TaxID=3364370 RepID=UPI0037B87B36